MHKFFVPGRIEVLGKHTDYAGGRSLLCATERGFRLLANPRPDQIVTVTDAATGASDTLALDAELLAAPGHWPNYPRTVARRLARNFPQARRGADIVFESDLPQAAGLSSSSAFIVATFLALAAVNDLEQHEEYAAAIRTPEELATYLACVESGADFGALEGDRGVGTTGGSEDHTAMLCCSAGRLSEFSFCPVRFERSVAAPQEYIFAIAVSGVVARKTGSAMESYNRTAAQATALLECWRQLTGRTDRSLAAALNSAPDAVHRLRGAVDPRSPLAGRLEQFVEESFSLIPSAVRALEARDLTTFGAVADRSQRLAESTLGNQVPETVALARSARELGAAAASAFGAGSGGSVWALVGAEEAEEFLDRWALRYRREFPERAGGAAFFTTRAGPAASEV